MLFVLQIDHTIILLILNSKKFFKYSKNDIRVEVVFVNDRILKLKIVEIHHLLPYRAIRK